MLAERELGAGAAVGVLGYRIAMLVVGSAAFGHLLFGDVRLAVTASLLIGAFPGVFAGALLSSRANPKVVKPALFAVLTASGLKLVQVF